MITEFCGANGAECAPYIKDLSITWHIMMSIDAGQLGPLDHSGEVIRRVVPIRCSGGAWSHGA